MTEQLNIQWAHAHDFGIDDKQKENKVKMVFALTTIIMVLEIAAGTWSGSMALLADGWHMGTHSAAFAIAIFAYSYARKHSNNQSFSFGTGKVNYLGGFASAVALAIVALMMIIESVQRILEPNAILFNEAIIVAIIGLTVNVISVFLLHDDHHHHHHDDHHHDHHGHEHHHDHNLKAAYFHVLADTLTSVLAIIALLAGKFYGLLWVDAIMGIVGAVIIMRWSYGLVKESSSILLDKSVTNSALCKAVEDIQATKDTIITDLHSWKVASADQSIIFSINAKEPLETNQYKEIIKKYMPQLSHISIEVNKI
ncbi:MAG: CDF family Co(II)/Ni(II) efflux transporter DmeF [Gammaproteobacteria bacterium]|nr:CDF family Co(II)/Ni(II) efflux transporter DmeF [Gammaproteobacteria bacterium]